MTVASLIVDVWANTAKLTKDVEDVNKNLNKVTSMAGDVAKALAAAFTVTAIVGAAKQVIDYASHLVDLEAKTGLTTTALQKLEGVFEASGISIDSATGAVLKLQKGLGGDDQGLESLVGKLGLSFTSLKQMAPEQAFFTIADAIGKIPNQNEKALASTIAFGKGGMELLAGLDGHLEETANKFEAMGLIIDEKTVHAADEFGDQLGLLGKQLLAITASVIGPLLPALSALGQLLLWIGDIVKTVLTVTIKVLQTAIGGLLWGLAEMLGTMADLATKIPLVGKHLGFMGDAAVLLHGYAQGTADAVKNLWTDTDKAGASAAKTSPALLGLGKDTDDAGAAAARAAKAFADAAEAWDKLQAKQDKMLDHGPKLTGTWEGMLNQAKGLRADGLLPLGAGFDLAAAAARRAADEWEHATKQGQLLSDLLVHPMTAPKITSGFGMGDLENITADTVKATTALQGMADMFTRLGQVSGGSLGHVMSSVGQVAVMFEAAEKAGKKSLASDMFDKSASSSDRWASAVGTASTVAGGAVEMFHSKSVLGATMAGMKAGAAFGPWGAAIGAGIGAVYGGLKKLLGGASEAEKAARSANRAYEDSIASTLTAQQQVEAGHERWKMTVIGVRDLYLSTGRTAADASDVVSRMWAAEKQGAAAVKVVQEEINKALALRQMMADGITALSSAEDKYHFTSVANSADLYKNYQLLINGQHDATDVLTRMHDDFQALVTDALTFGTTLPQQMRDPLEKLVKMGLLTDEAGNKLTDLGRINFSETGSSGQTAFDKITSAVDTLVAAIRLSLHLALSDTQNDLLGLPHNLPNPFEGWTIDPGTLAWLRAHDMTPEQYGLGPQYRTPPPDPGDGVATGGLVTPLGIQHFAMGGNVLRGAFGTDTVPAMLTPGEMVLNAGQQRAVGSLMRQGGGGNSSALHSEIKGLRADLRAQHDREARNQGIEQRKLVKALSSAVKRAAA